MTERIAHSGELHRNAADTGGRTSDTFGAKPISLPDSYARWEANTVPETSPKTSKPAIFWPKLRRSDRRTVLLFDVEAIPVAYALYRRDSDSIYLRHLFVARQHRRAGIGRQAMDLLVGEIWPPGWRVTVEVLVTNHRAYAFWQALGFQDYALTLELHGRGGDT